MTKYTKQSDRRLILVLDGVDQVDEGDDRKKLPEFIRQAAGSDCKIQIIFTSNASYPLLADQELKIPQLELNREKVTADLKKVTSGRIQHLTRLKKLDTSVRNRIAKEVARKADSTLFHFVTRHNGLHDWDCS